ncbi:NAD(P)H dehydrogenase (quinone) [Rhizomicrobium palustre]|uniref:NAD(P)H dehydrogenase (Quinone) n=1 Tax=Rhizomicrobium palustre TaxID=189966 RepID=A0A846N0H9_9PROT|nr:SDR family oxidoreductase [Rhizomicrobium palustre]NIK89454.1 NAD(P)H dehydrogenase (quinone) [Rhizomicrobium palustre]
MSHTIAVTGATGQLGRLVIAALKTRLPASEIVALVRDPAKAQDLGVTTRAFNYNTPDAAALEGVEKLLLISGSEIGQREAQHKAVIAATKAAGVKFIAYTSLLRADSSALDLAVEHKATEEAVKASGLPFTLLRNSWYTENYAGSIAAALAHGALVGSAAAGKASAAARADYAEAAAVVLTTSGHEGKTYELAGDTAFTLSDLAEEISRQSGKQIPYHDLPIREYAKILEGAGLPAPFAAMVAGWEGPISLGALFDDSHTLSKLINRPTTPISALIAGLVKG